MPAVASVAALAPVEAAGRLVVTTTGPNLRAKPRSRARVFRVMPAKSTVTLILGGSGANAKVVDVDMAA